MRLLGVSFVRLLAAAHHSGRQFLNLERLQNCKNRLLVDADGTASPRGVDTRHRDRGLPGYGFIRTVQSGRKQWHGSACSSVRFAFPHTARVRSC